MRLAWIVVAWLAGGVASAAQERLLELGAIPSEAPWTVDARATSTEVTFDVTVEKGWHLYGRDVGGGEPVHVVLDAQSRAAVGALQVPPSDDGKLRGAFRLTLPLDGAAASSVVSGTLRFMVCDALQCLPPVSVRFSGTVTPLRVLLVAGELTAREQGIASLLQQRGIDCTTTTYAEVSAKVCEAHEVVLADSRLFRQLKTTVAQACALPQTETPIVAVGFLGTELIEAHGLAMTSGYI